MCFNDKHDVSSRCQRLVLRVILLWLLVPAIVGCSRETITNDQAGARAATPEPDVSEDPKPDGAENSDPCMVVRVFITQQLAVRGRTVRLKLPAAPVWADPLRSYASVT